MVKNFRKEEKVQRPIMEQNGKEGKREEKRRKR